jgi:hypothetical protein
MKIRKFIVISFAIALLATIISLIVGKLMAPGVYYTIEGGFIGVELKTEIKKYIVHMFISFFVCSYLACYLSDLWVGRKVQ